MSLTDDGTDDTVPADLADLPPSAKLVYKVLEYEGCLTQAELAAETRLCTRTVRYAVDNLEAAGCIDCRRSLKDARRSIYWIED